MKLSELSPQFLRRQPDGTMVSVNDISEADGVMFLCPKCFSERGGPVGTHSVICWSPKIPPDVDPKPGRWNLVGTGYGDLSLIAGSSSVRLMSGCEAHFFVTEGEIR